MPVDGKPIGRSEPLAGQPVEGLSGDNMPKTTKTTKAKKARKKKKRSSERFTPTWQRDSDEVRRTINPPGSKHAWPRPGRRGLDIGRPVPEFEPGDDDINRAPRTPFDGGVDSAIIQPRRGKRAPFENKLTPPIGRRCILEHAPAASFAPQSFRYKAIPDDDQGRVILYACPYGQWDPSRGKNKECAGGMKAHITMVGRNSRTDPCPDGLYED